jgi:protein-L-isoaspartate(D-aspartate) O-methyltransferase
MVIPVGERFDQRLVRITKRNGELARETLEPTLFVPMTGTAEESRRVRPDGTRPALRNGGFDEVVAEGPVPAAWYYGRQATVVSDGAGQGGRRLRLQNTDLGRPAQIFQGFAVDGAQVGRLRLRARIRGTDLAQGRTEEERPLAVIKFLDRQRRRSLVARVGPWTGTFDWRAIDERVNVPTWASEASLMLALGGGTGTLEVDDVAVVAETR